jgi:hypothetical protein
MMNKAILRLAPAVSLRKVNQTRGLVKTVARCSVNLLSRKLSSSTQQSAEESFDSEADLFETKGETNAESSMVFISDQQC